MKSNTSIRYTLRQVPARVDRSLRQKSKQAKRSLNETAIDALSKGLGLGNECIRFHDLDALAGTWVEDAKFDEAISLQERVDPQLWK